jgi:8-oxo-dGTP pyrophosphatase MutT (NUDIX family)
MERQFSCWIIPIYLKDNEIYLLLVKWWHDNRWFPKWQIEEHEVCYQAALREFNEETNIPIDFIDFKKDFVFEDKYWFFLSWQKIFKVVKYYISFLKDGFDKYINPQKWEITEIKLIKIDEVDKYLKFKSLLDIVNKVKKLLVENKISEIK